MRKAHYRMVILRTIPNKKKNPNPATEFDANEEKNIALDFIC